MLQQNYSDVEDNHLRMVEICNNHPMFQFLFDESGKLLAANKRATYNMREHLGERPAATREGRAPCTKRSKQDSKSDRTRGRIRDKGQHKG